MNQSNSKYASSCLLLTQKASNLNDSDRNASSMNDGPGKAVFTGSE